MTRRSLPPEMRQAIRVVALVGGQARPYLDDLARLRMQVFREYPYLYDGSPAYERQYLSNYLEADNSLVVVAFDGERVIGVSTGLPMTGAEEAFAQPFLERGHDLSRIFYFGESVLEKQYRGLGLGHCFFDEREAYAARLGGYELTCFCAVVRASNDPRRTVDYRSLEPFWRKRGYAALTGVTAQLAWREVDADKDVPNRLQFWARKLTGC